MTNKDFTQTFREYKDGQTIDNPLKTFEDYIEFIDRLEEES